MTKKLKIGIMGGERGRYVLGVEKKLFDFMEVTALCEINPKVIENLKEENLLHDGVSIYEDFDEFINSGLDGVVLCNYFHEHAKYAIKAMKTGVPVLSETTAAPSLGECVQLVEAYEETKTKYMLGANGLWSRTVQAMKRDMEENKYGEVVFADTEYLHASLEKKAHPRIPGSGTGLDLNDLHWRKTLPGCYYNMHDMGPMMYITDTMPKKVVAKATATKDHQKELVNFDKSYALVEMDNGAVFNSSGCTIVGVTSKWYRFACRDGMIESVRYNDDRDKIIECGTEERPVTRELTWSGTGAVTPEEEAICFANDGHEMSHGGIDLVLMVHFLRYLRGEEEAYFDVYKSVALSATAILSWYSILLGSKEMEIPDFKSKEERDKVRNDFRMPFAKSYVDLTLPCNVGEPFEL